MSVNSYAPAPFWFLNHRLDKEELLRQLRLMKESGVSGFFIHPRAGLDTPYGSKEWFDCVQFIVEEAEKLGLNAWLYDEDPFPSGAAGGRLMLENPAFCARNLCHYILTQNEEGVFEANLGAVSVLYAVSYRRDENGFATDVRDVTEQVGMVRRHYHKSEWNSSYFCDWRPDVPYPHYRAETFFPEMSLRFQEEAGREVCVVYTEESVNDGKYGKAPDCMNPECTKRFLELTHEKYKELLGDKFGTVIPGIFTDEPVPGGGLPWTGSLEAAFREEHGYDLREQLWKLWLPSENAESLRRDYWSTVSNLYQKNFLQPIARWCQENGLLFTGHMPGEESIMSHPYVGGSAYTLMKYLDIPGFDILGNNLGNIERPSLIFGGKSISSAARQQGKKKVLCEAFACNGFDFGLADMRRVTDWLFALGINWIVPHGFYYSYDGYRKYDAGKSFFFQDPCFKDFPQYAEYAGKTGEFLASCEAVCDTALFYPAKRLTGYLPGEPKKGEALQKACFRAVSELCRRQIPFEILDEDTLECSYQHLVVVEESDRQYAGGRKTYLADCKEEMDLLRNQAAGIRFCGEHTEHLLTDQLKEGADPILFVFNNSEQEVTFRLEGEKPAYTVDCVAGGAVAHGNQWNLKAYHSLVLRVTDRELELLPEHSYPESFQTFRYKTPNWVYEPEGVTATIATWDVQISSKGEKTCWEQKEACPVRELLGTELGELIHLRTRPIFDQAPRVPSVYPVEAVYTSEFICETGEPIYLVTEGSTLKGNWTLYLNGKQLPKERFVKHRIYDATNQMADVTEFIQEGRNRIEIRFAEAMEDDGLYSSMYLYQKPEVINE